MGFNPLKNAFAMTLKTFLEKIRPVSKCNGGYVTGVTLLVTISKGTQYTLFMFPFMVMVISMYFKSNL